jgi:hypothetical protein
MDAGLLSRRQDFSIQTAELDVDVSVVLGVLCSYETVKAKGVVEGDEPSVEEGHIPKATGVILRHSFLPLWVAFVSHRDLTSSMALYPREQVGGVIPVTS